VARKLGEEGMWLEQECIVGVEGQIHEDGLELMKAGLPIGKRQLPPCRVSWQNENHLRFALKGIAPDEIDAMCTEVGLRVVSLRRLRIGRLSLAKVPRRPVALPDALGAVLGQHCRVRGGQHIRQMRIIS